MVIEEFEAGPVATKGYLVADGQGGAALAIDAPQGTAGAMVAKAREWGVSIAMLIDTHGHWDHILDNAALRRLSGARLGTHPDTAPLLAMPQTAIFGLDIDLEPTQPDFLLQEGTPLRVGALEFEVRHCPGHCPGSVVLYAAGERAVFVGDVLFAGSIGRTDLPGGDYEMLLRSIREKLLSLGDEVRVFSGHGPATTIGRERRGNPFLVPGRG